MMRFQVLCKIKSGAMKWLRRFLYQLTFLDGLYSWLCDFFGEIFAFWMDLYLYNGRICFGCGGQDGMHRKVCWLRDFGEGGPPQGMKA